MKLKNTWKHLLVGGLVGFFFGIIVNIFRLQSLQWFIAIAFFFATLAWEQAQKARAVIWNWLDAIVDVLAGNVAFLVIYLCIIK
jgi:type IV secretory pathway VirB2 component (pilin)